MESSVGTQSFVATTEISKGRLWTGRIITGLIALFLLLDAAMKLAKPAPVIAAFRQTGWPVELSAPIGAILLICTVFYLIPRTSVFGAVLLTGYLGGAVATNMRLQNPLFSYTLVPVYFGVLLWASIMLRTPRLGDLFPLIRKS
jgi:DoxX-like family